MTLLNFILFHCKNKRSVFTERYGVSKQCISQWIKLGYVVRQVDSETFEVVKIVQSMKVAND